MLLAKEKEEEQGADSRSSSSSRRSSFSASSYLGSSSSTSSTSTGTPSTSTPSSSFLASLARATNDPNASPSSFLSLLIRPVQMVPRYRLLLDRLVEVAAKDEAKNRDKNMSTNKNSAAAVSDESSDWCSSLEGGQRDWCSLEERLDLEHAGQAVQQVAAKLNDSLKVNCSWCLSSSFSYNADAQSAWNWIVVVC